MVWLQYVERRWTEGIAIQGFRSEGLMDFGEARRSFQSIYDQAILEFFEGAQQVFEAPGPKNRFVGSTQYPCANSVEFSRV